MTTLDHRTWMDPIEGTWPEVLDFSRREVRDGSTNTTRAAGTDSCGLDSDPVIEAYKRDIDRTLLRENLKLTVEERFLKLEALQRFAAELRRAGHHAAQ